MNQLIARSTESELRFIEEAGGRVRLLENGTPNPQLQDMLDAMAAGMEPLGGTFYPEPGSLLAYHQLLTEGPLAELYPDMEIVGSIGEILHEEGIIY